MTYQAFTQQFKFQISTLSFEKQINLAIEICKQLFNDYKEFALRNNWGNSDLILDTIKFTEAFKNGRVEEGIIEQRKIQIEDITPDTEDFGDASYALNACIAVYATLDFMIDHNSDYIYEIGTCMTDTVDFKIQEDDELTEDLIDRNPEMIAARRFLIEMSK